HFIFLFIGGFSIALAMQRWKLDVRLAGTVLSIAGNNPKLIIIGFMLSAALLSAFISNTATTAVMLPIGLSIILLFAKNDKDEFDNADQHNFTRCLLLCIAYSASIGGTMTLIGTAPNLFLASFLEEGIPSQYKLRLSFIEWASFAAPLAILFLPIIYLVLTKLIFPFDINKLNKPKALEFTQQGKMDRGQKITIIIFILTVLLWATRPLIQGITFGPEFEIYNPFSLLSDSGIAMIAAMLLFVIPVNFKKRIFVMDWQTATQLPWGIFILFGGGLTLAKAIKDNGVAEFFAAQALLLPDLPGYIYVLIIVGSIIFLTELTSNTATTATLVPILASIAIGLNIHPYLFIFPATLAASFAFMMPIATPPNTIVFASGHISIPEMCKAGFWLNIIGTIMITCYTYLVIKPVIGF
ncbi:MAG: DASS family sodium-coupled anion symporter, partial [Pseudomonadota bacterium]